MKLNVSMLTGLSVLFLTFGCAQTKLYDYQPATAPEKEVVDFFVECDKAIGEKNLEKFLACYSESANIRIFKGEGSNPVVSKAEYQKHLEDGQWQKMESNTLKNPKVSVNADKATIKCNITYGSGWTQWYTFDMVKEGGKWSIVRQDYKWTS